MVGEIPPGEGNGYPLQYSCLKNPMNRGAWQATAHGVTESQTSHTKVSMVEYCQEDLLRFLIYDFAISNTVA